MTGQFGLEDGGLHPLSEIHGEVADGLGQLTGSGTPHSGDVSPALGHIASSMHRALGGTMESRGGTFQTTQRSSGTIAGHLKQAHNMYMGTDETGARDITTASNLHTGAGNGGLQGSFSANHYGGNGIQDDPQNARGTSGDPSGGAAGSSGTPTGGSSGTPADAASPSGHSTGATPHGATGAATSAAPISAHDVAGGVGGAAATGQSLSQVLDQAGQHASSTGHTAARDPDEASQNQGQLPKEIMQTVSQFGEAGGGEHGALGASAQSLQALGHRSETPDDHGEHRGAEPHDEAPPPDDDEPDDDELKEQPHDPPPQAPVPPPPSAPAPTVPPRQPSGRPDTRKT